MERGFPESAKHERFEIVSGLRAAAVVGVLAYEVLRLVPGIQFSQDFAHRAALSGWHGFELLLVLSAFGLAAPVLAARRRRGAAVLSVTRFALGRVIRIVPAFAVVFGALVLARHDLNNDGFSALAVQVGVTALFPLLLAIFVFAPAIFGVFGALTVAAGLLLPAGHAYDVGAVLPFMLGIVLADLWARRIPLQRFAWAAVGLAVVATGGALFADPLVSGLPGPLHARAFGLWNPLWSFATAALLFAAIARPAARRGSWPGVAQLAAASYAIVLLAQPLAALGFAQFGHLAGAGTAGAAAALVLAASGALWFAVDRFFSGARHDALVAVFGDRLPALALRFGRPTSDAAARPAARAATTAQRPKRTAIASTGRAYGALPTMHPGMLATVIQRVGSHNDLRAEVDAAKQRIGAARGGAYEPVPFIPAAAPALARFVMPQTPLHKIVSVAFVAPPPPRAAKVRMHFGPQARGARAS